MAVIPQAWGMRAKPHNHNRMVEFLANDIVALGWPGVGNLAGMDRRMLGKTVKKAYSIRDNRELGRNVGTLDTFVNRVKSGDLVVVPSPEDGDVYMGRFEGGYRYNRAAEKDSYPHQRRVKWLFGKRRTSRDELPSVIASALKAHQPIFSIDGGSLGQFVRHKTKQANSKGANVNDSEFEALEGDIDIVPTRVARRVRRLREAKIAEALKAGGGRLRCEVPRCGFDFEERYGELGRGYIHVHHREQLRGVVGRRVRNVGDLAIVCANCHAMIHRFGQCRDLEGLIVQPGILKPRRTVPKKRQLIEKVVLVNEPGFDPNRPDLQDFLDRVSGHIVDHRRKKRENGRRGS